MKRICYLPLIVFCGLFNNSYSQTIPITSAMTEGASAPSGGTLPPGDCNKSAAIWNDSELFLVKDEYGEVT